LLQTDDKKVFNSFIDKMQITVTKYVCCLRYKSKYSFKSAPRFIFLTQVPLVITIVMFYNVYN